MNLLALPATQPVTGRASPCSKQEIEDAPYFSLCAIAGIGFTALAASSPAQAAYHLIRWQDSGFCQIWDQGIPTAPYPGNYTVIVGSEVPTFVDALVFKDGLLRNGTCSL